MNTTPSPSPAAGTLFLIPVPLGPTPPDSVLPAAVCEQTRQLRHFIAENAKSARAFLKTIGMPVALQEIQIRELNEHTRSNELPALLEDLRQGNDVGLVSEAGCPGVADPGADLVRLAQRESIPVSPLVGPSSLLLALMGSGLCGQRFAFHGYLPAKEDERSKRLKALEQESRRLNQTQMFIETPYRNTQMMESLTRHLTPDTLLCLASSLTLPQQRLRTRTIAQWRKEEEATAKEPTVFLFLAP
ncbi:SAM-dependent methyltransferase [Azospira sp. I13]|uniref:SAM-dependent methyltransferase n=1 Tax=Azospira sp. I13 TaxID=1765050 RepID=UPI000D590913|nr:SAM-dependent methyltransferase [Azospira sp. I13]